LGEFIRGLGYSPQSISPQTAAICETHSRSAAD